MAAWMIGIIVLIFIVYIIWENQSIETTHYSVKIPFISPSLKGMKMVHLSDLHIGYQKKNIQKLSKRIKEESPDMIVVTGDIVQAGLEEFPEAEVRQLGESLADIAPTYVISGNHDLSYLHKKQWQNVLSQSGVHVLLDAAVWIPYKESGIVLMGLAEKQNMKKTARPLLQHIHLSNGMLHHPKILLAHRPEYFEEYLDDHTKIPDLILSGHTHGGQIRLPFIGGVAAPGQGFFPTYDYGYFYKDTEPAQRLIINRGIGNSSFPFRVFNRPEIGVVTLD